MQQALSDMLLMVLAYFLIIVGTIIFLNFLTNSFLLTYIRVKAGRGKIFFLRINYVGGRYYRIGKLKDNKTGMVQYKDQSKEVISFNIERSDVVMEMGVKCIEYDESTNSVVRKDYSATTSHNTEKVDSLLERALYKPQLMDKSMIQILIVVGILILICMVGFLVFNELKVKTALENLAPILQNMSMAINPPEIMQPSNVI